MTWVNSFRGRESYSSEDRGGGGTTIKRIPHDWEHSNQKSGLEAKRRAKPEDGDGDETEEGQTVRLRKRMNKREEER